MSLSPTQAARLYHELQWGRLPRERVGVHVPRGVPRHTAQLGLLDHLVLVDGREVRWPGARLTVGVPPGGGRRALYIQGAAALLVPQAARRVRIRKVVYVTAKGRRPNQRFHHTFLGTLPMLDAYAGGEARIRREGSIYTVTERGIEG